MKTKNIITVETKFNIGDFAFAFKNDKLTRFEVKAIHFSITKDKTIIYYADNENGTEFMYSSLDVFESKEELIKYIEEVA